jgi:hypothetical protein
MLQAVRTGWLRTRVADVVSACSNVEGPTPSNDAAFDKPFIQNILLIIDLLIYLHCTAHRSVEILTISVGNLQVVVLIAMKSERLYEHNG